MRKHAVAGAKVDTDEWPAYERLPNREKVRHRGGEYVWSMLKRSHKGVYYKLSAKHLQRYVAEFAGRHNMRELEQIQYVVAGLVGRRLMYRDLVTD